MVINHICHSKDEVLRQTVAPHNEVWKIKATRLRKEAPPSAINTLGDPFLANTSTNSPGISVTDVISGTYFCDIHTSVGG